MFLMVFLFFQNTPDLNFILDVHPAWKNVVIGAGFSGKLRLFSVINIINHSIPFLFGNETGFSTSKILSEIFFFRKCTFFFDKE